MKPGDLIAVSGKGPLSNLIQVGTFSLPNVGFVGSKGWSGISHVGIVCPVWDELLVYESTSMSREPCVRTGRQEPKGVQAHYPSSLLNSDDVVWHYPLRRALYEHEVLRLSRYLESCLGRGYDLEGAGKTAGGIISWLVTSTLGDDARETLFCSELVASAWQEVGVMQVKNPGAWNPNRLLRVGRRQGILGKGERLT